MRRVFLILALAIAMAGCRPTTRDCFAELGKAFQPYVTGDAYAAKDALLAQERILAKHEAAGTRGIDYRQARLEIYARLCAVALHTGHTAEANDYFLKAVANKERKDDVTMEGLVAAIDLSDEKLRPKWRERK